MTSKEQCQDRNTFTPEINQLCMLQYMTGNPSIQTCKLVFCALTIASMVHCPTAPVHGYCVDGPAWCVDVECSAGGGSCKRIQGRCICVAKSKCVISQKFNCLFL
uniref:EB domain-containing protein n=1 Tax=Romanomermis culicivorax TaxID=13658 RepID=A0A915I062_ROMCU